MPFDEEWDVPQKRAPGDIYALEEKLSVPLGEPYPKRDNGRGNGKRRGSGRQRDLSDTRNSNNQQQGFQTEERIRKNDYYQLMNEMNYPADEQFRKESQIMMNRVERDKRMMLKKIEKDKKAMKSGPQLVIPCRFSPAMNLKNEEETESVHPSTRKIEAFINLSRDTIMDGIEEAVPRRDAAIEHLMMARSADAALQLTNSPDSLLYSICLSFEDYPPAFVPRQKQLKTIVIDGCAVMKHVNFNFEVPWNPTGGAIDVFKGNKLLVMKPLIELAMRFLLQGHKTVIILPKYYKIPVFAGLRQKVDNVSAFEALVETGIVHFIDEAIMEEMHQKLHEENEKRDGTWVSTSVLERIILGAKKRETAALEKKQGPSDVRKQNNEPSLAVFTHRITPFFYDNKLVLPLHMSTPSKTILYSDVLLYHDNGEILEERRRDQMTREEQKTILVRLQDAFDLPLKLLRGMMMFRRILKEIEDKEKDEK